MGADCILQLKKPFLLPHPGPAEKNMGLDAHVLDLFYTDDFVDIDTQELMVSMALSTQVTLKPLQVKQVSIV